MQEGLWTDWSFGYTVPDGGEELKDGVNEISQVNLVEAGPTLKGANPEAQLQAVKALQWRRGVDVGREEKSRSSGTAAAASPTSSTPAPACSTAPSAAKATCRPSSATRCPYASPEAL